MPTDAALQQVAELFKVLGHEARLELVRLVSAEPRSVSQLVEATGLSQPLVSQHLRVLRQADLVEADRRGREVIYHVSDHHVTHIIEDAHMHVSEPAPSGDGSPAREGQPA